jgi:hypothetical protein
VAEAIYGAHGLECRVEDIMPVQQGDEDLEDADDSTIAAVDRAMRGTNG